MAQLRVEGISVSFGGLLALDGVDLEAPAGRVTGLIGPNGAGKTTLFNVVCGLQEPTRGRVLLDHDDITRMKAHKRARRGLARTFQRLEVFGSLTARENILTASEIRRGWSRDRVDAAKATDELVVRVGLAAVAEQRVDTLSTGLARLVELGRALATRPRVLLLDEPSSGLDGPESQAFGALVGELAGEGLAVLLVEHDMGLVMRVCGRIHVLDFGRVIACGTPEEIQTNPEVQAAYLGEPAAARA